MSTGTARYAPEKYINLVFFGGLEALEDMLQARAVSEWEVAVADTIDFGGLLRALIRALEEYNPTEDVCKLVREELTVLLENAIDGVRKNSFESRFYSGLMLDVFGDAGRGCESLIACLRTHNLKLSRAE